MMRFLLLLLGLKQSGYFSFASFMNFPMYQMDVKSAFLYGTIEEELVESLSTYLLDNGFHRGQIDKTLFIKRLKGDILLVQVYVDDIIFVVKQKEDGILHLSGTVLLLGYLGEIWLFCVRTVVYYGNQQALTKDEMCEDVDVHLYSDYAGASLDRKSTTGGCQFLGSRLISWQCKKQTVVANSTTEAEYIAASHCCGQIPQSGGPPRNVGDEVATTPSSFEAEQDSVVLRCQEENHIGDVDAHYLVIITQHYSSQYPIQTSQPPNTQPTPDAGEAVPIPHESPLHSVHSLGRNKGSLSLNELTDLCTSLSNKVQSLETELKEIKQTYNSALTQLIRRDPSKQRRSLIEELDMDTKISLVPPHAVNEGRNDDTQIYDLPTEQLEVFIAATALADAAKRRRSIETAQTYTRRRRRSVSTGSGRVNTTSRTVSTTDVSTSSELGSTAGVKTKDKGKAIMQESEPPKKVKKRVQVQMSMDEKLAKKVFEEEQQIDWNDPAVLRYHAQLNRPYSVAEARKNMVMYLKNQEGYKMDYFKGMKYEDIRPIFEEVWDQIQSFSPIDSKKEKDSEKIGSRKKSLARKIADGSFKNYKIFSEMLDDFDRHDVLDLHRLVKARYMTSSPEGYDLMLWGDLKILFEPDEEDEV
ncbi:hypothetical protein Tco_1172389 [Tanacetum coccineum]